MARDGLANALQPMQPMQPMANPVANGGRSTGPGYAPMQGQFGNGYNGQFQQLINGSGLPPIGGYRGPGQSQQVPGAYMPQQGMDVGLYGARQPMGFMSPASMWGGNGGWGTSFGGGGGGWGQADNSGFSRGVAENSGFSGGWGGAGGLG